MQKSYGGGKGKIKFTLQRASSSETIIINMRMVKKLMNLQFNSV